jgi:hypothetical protein
MMVSKPYYGGSSYSTGLHGANPYASPYSAAMMAGGSGGSYYEGYPSYETAMDFHGPGFY